MWRRVPGEGSYARIERERRFLLDAVPDGAVDPHLIVDRYLLNSRLRLRKISDEVNSTYKLAQKVRLVAGDPTAVKITNIYLDEDEYEVLAPLQADELVKTRYTLTLDERRFAIDEFHDRLAGLVLAEEQLDDDVHPRPLPAFAVCDVSDDDRYSGGCLAVASRAPEDGRGRQRRRSPPAAVRAEGPPAG